eukprot:Skav226092  [mRNA]  locus=scaffold4179:25911:29066:- [translate_table: standard]
MQAMHPVGRSKARLWEAGYALSPATENWARHVREANKRAVLDSNFREADRSRPALAVGFVGATSAGKSWLVSKLQSDGAAQPARFEESFAGGVDLQSMTSDINLYMDPVDHLYYVDFEGTFGTLPLQYYAADVAKVVQRCADVMSWESKRRQALKESFQPAVAYLMCDARDLKMQHAKRMFSGIEMSGKYSPPTARIDANMEGGGIPDSGPEFDLRDVPFWHTLSMNSGPALPGVLTPTMAGSSGETGVSQGTGGALGDSWCT